MNFSFTYQELTNIANQYLENQIDNEKYQFKLAPIDQGFLINVERLKVSFLNFKAKIKLQINQYSDGYLVIGLKFKNFFYEGLKKFLFAVVLKLLQKVMAKKSSAEMAKYVHFSANHITIEVNNILTTAEAPLSVQNITTEEHALGIQFEINQNFSKMLKA